MKTSTKRSLQVEALENRELMAGNVSVYFQGSDLMIVGDAARNGVEVRQTNPGVYKISGAYLNGETKINGRSGPCTATGVNGNVKISLGGGDDGLDFGVGDRKVISVARDLFIDMGAGNDWTMVRDIKTNGQMIINTGSGVDKTFVNNANVGTNMWIYDAPASVNAGDRDEATVLSSTVRGRLALAFRGGNDSVEIQSSVANDIYADMGDGNDFFKMIYSRSTSGGFAVSGGRGTDTFFVPDYAGTRYNGSNFESIRR